MYVVDVIMILSRRASPNYKQTSMYVYDTISALNTLLLLPYNGVS